MKKLTLTSIVLGTLSVGMFAGYEGCKYMVKTVAKDKKFISNCLIPAMVKSLGQEKVSKIIEIINEV